MSFELLPLDCPTCGSSVRAAGGDVVYYCVSCRNGYQLDDEARGLKPVDVGFVAASNVVAQRYLPFWHLPATIDIRTRDAAGGLGGLFQAFSSVFRPAPGPRQGEGAFVVPAFQAPLEALTELTRRYTLSFPSLGEKLGERLLGGCFGAVDAKKLAHFALIATEVDKPDTLKRLEYSLEFGGERLLGVPFVRDEEGWKDSIHGVGVGAVGE